MKILHICLTGCMTDGWSYQDNLLPKYHKIQGNDVYIITNRWIYNSKGKPIISDKISYINNDKVHVLRLNMNLKEKFSGKFNTYKNFYKSINKIQPDIIFVHGCQFLDIYNVINYAKRNPNIRIYVDNHCDLSNSATNWVSKNILHKIIWRIGAKSIEPYTTKFYGVLPSRVSFLHDIYNIKTPELLVMGADDEKVKEASDINHRNAIRSKYSISSEDFLIMTGGKIDSAKKQTFLLMEAVNLIKEGNVKLIVFGSVSEELKECISNLNDGIKIQYIGWVDPNETYKYFVAADLVVFPGRHSVFWEQVAGMGIPMVCKYWQGTTHVDLGGNVKFLYKDSKDEIKSVLDEIISNKELYQHMKNVGEEKGMKVFSYREIASRSIEV